MPDLLTLSLTDALRAFINANCGDGTRYTTPDEFVRDVLRQRMAQAEAAKARASIVAGYQDAIAGRVHEFDGDLRSLLKKAGK